MSGFGEVRQCQVGAISTTVPAMADSTPQRTRLSCREGRAPGRRAACRRRPVDAIEFPRRRRCEVAWGRHHAAGATPPPHRRTPRRSARRPSRSGADVDIRSCRVPAAGRTPVRSPRHRPAADARATAARERVRCPRPATDQTERQRSPLRIQQRSTTRHDPIENSIATPTTARPGRTSRWNQGVTMPRRLRLPTPDPPRDERRAPR